MSTQKNYKKTLIACYLGFITQAISANFAPLLFLTFRSDYGLSLGQVAAIPLVFYLAQLAVDLGASRFADRIGYRACVVASQFLSAAGLLLMALLPDLLPSPFVGVLIPVVLYAVGSGLIEVLVSPIVEACPFEHKDGVMSLLHSFYCWGATGVILGSTLFFALFGVEHWKILAGIFAILPLVNGFHFLVCPIEKLDGGEPSVGIKNLLRTPIFWLMILLMVCAGSSEATMAQWASAFTESALGVSKAVGDLAGPCLFAVLMGVARLLYGRFSERLDLTRVMLFSGILCVGCYLLASLSAIPVFGLIGCALCGFSVGILWPGSISVSAQKCPRGGTAMFAFLALAGDFGAAVSPTLVGGVAAAAGDDLKIGLLTATIFPILLVAALLILRAKTRKERKRSSL